MNLEKDLKKMSYDSSTSAFFDMDMSGSKVSKKPEYDCFSCGRGHEKNTPNDLRVNTMVSLLVEKLWSPNVEVKRLRNEIRSYVVFELQNNNNKFDLEKYEYLFQQAYKRGLFILFNVLCLTINPFWSNATPV